MATASTYTSCTSSTMRPSATRSSARAAATPGFSFVDLPIVDIRQKPEAADWNLRCYAGCIAATGPDVILIGEIPLGGDLLASSLAAAQSGVPVIVVDDAYCPPSVEWMAAQHGPLSDALLLVDRARTRCARRPPASTTPHRSHPRRPTSRSRWHPASAPRGHA